MAGPLLEVDGLTQRFGLLAALARVSFEVGEGDLSGVIGPNGAGKTTLVNAVTGSLRGWSGEVRFAGRSLRGTRPHRVARLGIGRTFQVVEPLAQMTAEENVMVGALHGRGGGLSVAEARREARATLERLGLGEKADLPGERFNVPERKRLELAKVLAMRPRLLLLDEVMAGLNPAEIDEMVDVVMGIRASGVTIVIIEHVMQAIARLCDRVIVLHHGELVTEGTPDEVFGDHRVIDAYLGSRFGSDRPPSPGGEPR